MKQIRNSSGHKMQQSYQALIEAELPLDGKIWTVKKITAEQAELTFRNEKKSIPLDEFMQKAGLDPGRFDPSTVSSEEEPVHMQREVNQLENVHRFEAYKTDTEYERKSSLLFPRYPLIEIRRGFDKNKIKSFVAFDTEATGLQQDDDRIIQLSAVRFVDEKPVEYYDTFVNPLMPISYGAKQVTDITDAMLKDAPVFSEIADSFKEFVKDDPLVGYYIKFDLRMLWTHGLDLVTNHTIYDAQWYVFNLLPKGYLFDRKLSTVASHLGITFPAHDSLGDAYATGEIFIRAVNDIMNL